jgi:hypothetical protein
MQQKPNRGADFRKHLDKRRFHSCTSEVQVYNCDCLVGEACCNIIATALPAHFKNAALALVRLYQCAVLHVPDVQRLVKGAAGQIPAQYSMTLLRPCATAGCDAQYLQLPIHLYLSDGLKCMNSPAIGAECDRVHRLRVARECIDAGAALYVPQADRGVKGRRHEHLRLIWVR